MGSNKPKNKDKAELKENPRSNGKGSGEIIKDARFSSANWDPRFREAPKHKSKVKIDSRFTRYLLKNQSFAPSNASIDKRGKRKRKSSAFESLNRYYRIEGEEGSAKRRKNKKGEDSDSDTESESETRKTEDVGTERRSTKIKANKIKESQREDKELEEKKDRLRLKSQPESSDTESEEKEEEVEEDSDDSSTSLTDTDDDQMYEEEEEIFVQQEDSIPEIDKETHRLAVVNMDWSHVKAVDLFVVLSSFLRKGGQIKSVAVYPSEFGLKRMEEEAIHGPIGAFDNDKKKSGGGGEGDDEDEDESDDEDEDDDDNDYEDEDDDEHDDDDEDDDDDDDDEIDNEKLRAYELSRLRYYFAVVECDSVATADYLYKGCDGVEFERSSVKLDLRFIPDSMEFKHQPRDVATEAPSNYEGLDFFNRALQHSNINLTWDDDEPHRVKALKRKFNADQLAELELKEFLASDESESDDTEDDDDGKKNTDAKKKEKQAIYRALLQSGDGSDENDKDDAENLDMEVTFNTGLEDLSKRILEKKDAQSESVWDAYLRKKKEKRKARKNRSKDSSEDESSDNTDKEAAADEADDFFVEEESSGKASKKTCGKAAKKDHVERDPNSEATHAELELLIADDNGTDSNLKGYNLKRKKKGKTGKEIQGEGKLPTIDYEDPRFSALFTKQLFALDPTDPQFKRSAAYARQLAQKQQKGAKEDGGSREQAEISGGRTAITSTSCKPGDEENNELHKSKKEKAELSSLVRSLKMKTKQMPPAPPHHVKVSEKGVSSKLKKLHSKSRK